MNDDEGEDVLPVEEADAPPPVFPHSMEEASLTEVLLGWLALPAGRQQCRFLAAHPALLQPGCFALLDGWIRAEARQEEARRLRDMRSLLQDALERGGTVQAVCEAYVNAYGGFALDLPAWLEEVEGRLSALRSQGHPHQTAPARVELLRGALGRASGEPEMPPELRGTLQYELALAWQEHPPTDPSQAYETAIVLCDSALRSLSRDHYPRQHGDILNALGWTYARRVMGERRDNLERAISCHRQALQAFYAKKLEEGLSTTTVVSFHNVLHKALKTAVRWNLIARNPCDLVSPPRRKRFEIQPLNVQQIHQFLAIARGHRQEALFVLALATGMRRGELLGLKWQDLDLEQGILQVRRILTRIPSKLPGKGFEEAEPKTDKGRRRITLPSFAAEALRQTRLRQREAKLKAGPAWQDHNYVFCTSIGTHLNPTRDVLDALKSLLAKAGLPDIRFHDVRHSSATMLLGMKVHPKIVQEILGHSQIAITLVRLCRHFLEEICATSTYLM